MNRVFAIAAVVSMAVAGTAYAQQQKVADSSGCGFGTLLFEGEEGIAPQILAVTTNGTSGSQTFGITTGTLGCNSDGVVTPPEKVQVFTTANLDDLSRDIARGVGERLETLADLMGIEDQDKPAFFAATQRNFAGLFPSENVSAAEVLTALNRVLAADPLLRRYVFA